MIERLVALSRRGDRHLQVVANAILADVLVEHARAQPGVELRVLFDANGRNDSLAHRISSRSAAFNACSNVGSGMVWRLESTAFSA